MRILIVGAGAIGGYFGARLIAAARDVTFLVRPRRAEQLRNGLKVTSPLGDLDLPTPPVTTAETLRGFYDLVILSSKSYDLEASIHDFAPAVGPSSQILPLLNGLRHLDVLDARFGAGRVLGGLARISSTLDAEGRIHQLGTFNALAFGSRNRGSESNIEEIADALRVPGFDAHLSANILHEMWEKWVFIAAAAATTSLMRATVGDIVAAGAQNIPTGLLQECSAIAAANGFAPREAAMNMGISILTAPGSLFTASMLRDIEQGSRIEADHIVGDLLKRSPGSVHSPLLATAYAHLRAYEERRKREAGS
ncbi:MAG: ketopantoate reductase family protein [Pseudomonadota bacterium]|nr:ketopantoate reductase family protein [Pseudomonadota bacterium]